MNINSRKCKLLTSFCIAFMLNACGMTPPDATVSSITTQLGSTIELYGKSEVCCGGQYEQTLHRYRLNVTNRSLPWGTKVILHYGFKSINLDANADNEEQVRNWQDLNWSEFNAIAPYHWRIEFSHVSHQKGESERFSDLQFIVKFIYPDGKVAYERGSTSDYGFLEAKDPSLHESCLHDYIERDVQGWCELRLIVVE